MTLVQRAAAIVANNASLAAHAADSIGAQQALQESLLNRHLSDSGVNIDEELAQLIIYQQAFSASARVISTINSMFDALENIF
jgi:flagellar hook-associated protein 1 FlgK